MSINVLLVEDHTMTRMGLQLALDKVEEIKITGEAEDGEKAVELAKQLAPDVILMDIGLPGIDGIEATHKIKQLKLDAKILIFTSRDNEDDVFAAFSAGADGYIMKGASPDQLASAIKAVNDGTAWIDPAIAKLVLKNITQPRKTKTLDNEGNREGSSKKAAMAAGLTEREIEVLSLIVEGMSNARIAETLFITRATAKAHVHSILQKLCVDDRTQAAVTAMREGLV
ncbi:MAG TPA: response regulator transcription factor [Candidatus Gastranaerophilales bacterium]|nr:response regulator transcription factor [Candidatus Gastranaerophilales bacterium]